MWHGKLHPEQDQIGLLYVRPARKAGRLLEPVSDDRPRGMIAQDRTRLMASSFLFHTNYLNTLLGLTLSLALLSSKRSGLASNRLAGWVEFHLKRSTMISVGVDANTKTGTFLSNA